LPGIVSDGEDLWLNTKTQRKEYEIYICLNTNFPWFNVKNSDNRMIRGSTRLHACPHFKLYFSSVLMSYMQIRYHYFKVNSCVVTVSGLNHKIMQ